MQECHPERSEASLAGHRAAPKLALRMTQRDGLVFEMYWGLPPPSIFRAYDFALMV